MFPFSLSRMRVKSTPERSIPSALWPSVVLATARGPGFTLTVPSGFTPHFRPNTKTFSTASNLPTQLPPTPTNGSTYRMTPDSFSFDRRTFGDARLAPRRPASTSKASQRRGTPSITFLQCPVDFVPLLHGVPSAPPVVQALRRSSLDRLPTQKDSPTGFRGSESSGWSL